MTEENEKMATLVVISMNRPRLKKIMGIVEELKVENISSDSLEVVYVPCVASMGKYDNEDGEMVSYLANVAHLDGSTMKEYVDDDNFRSSLANVLLVGYEWKENDAEQIKNFFSASGLEVDVICVQPNSQFATLADEMEHFKHLNEEDKQTHVDAGSMGPGKMAKFIIDETINILKEETGQEQPTETPLETPDTTEEPDEQPSKPAGPRIDARLPRYACRMCRTVLFDEDCLAAGHVQNLHSFKHANFNAKRPTVACQSIFCSDTVLEWLAPAGTDIEGKLACPKCSFKIGHWKWSGAQCSCGTWVTPAIQIPASKVDKIQQAAPNSINAVVHSSMVMNKI